MGVVLFACIAIIIMCNSYDAYENDNINKISLINENPTVSLAEKNTEKVARKKKTKTKKAKSKKKKSKKIKKTDVGVKNNIGINISDEDYYWLCQIVYAEAGNQDDVGKILVANTIFNRVKSEDFPDNITDVIFDNTLGIYQFSPVKFGTVYTLHPDKSTVNCVNRAIDGEDYSDEVLYFSSEKSKYSWHNLNLSYLFTHGGHAFYK